MSDHEFVHITKGAVAIVVLLWLFVCLGIDIYHVCRNRVPPWWVTLTTMIAIIFMIGRWFAQDLGRFLNG